MPQLNPEFWISQIFWLVLTFGMLFIILSKLILPKISKNLEARKSQILENIEAAEKQREESENKIKEYEKIILNSKNETKNYFNEVRIKILKDINKKKEILENEINKEIKAVEKEIIDLKNNAPEKINKIAIETSSDLIKKLIGIEVNNSSISAIVENFSKKNKDKYYGI
jgi:F-type H+-transporting ATPase subunit b